MFQTIISELGRIWNGTKFDDSKELTEAWSSAQVVTGFNPKEIRKDVCGAWIVFEEFGMTAAKNGWLIDTYTEKTAQGEVKKIRALHVKNKYKRDAMLKQPQGESEDSNFCALTAKF